MSREIIEKIKKYFPESGGSGAAPPACHKNQKLF
jgi:hypothetical protein